MSKKFIPRKPITVWLKENNKGTLKSAAEEACKSLGVKATPNELYNFSKGTVRNPKIEKIFLLVGVPSTVIEETFNQ